MSGVWCTLSAGTHHTRVGLPLINMRCSSLLPPPSPPISLIKCPILFREARTSVLLDRVSGHACGTSISGARLFNGWGGWFAVARHDVRHVYGGILLARIKPRQPGAYRHHRSSTSAIGAPAKPHQSLTASPRTQSSDT